jgi:hypothetical protein
MAKRDLREDGRIVLAHGEVTGHSHELLLAVEADTVPAFDQAQFFEIDGRRELVVLAPCVLRHQEHDAMRLYPDGRAEKIDGRTGELTPAAYPALLRQGDVLLRSLGPGVWQHIRQIEQPVPGEWARVAD